MWDSYFKGKNTGHNDGTIGGMFGAMDHARDKREREAANNAAVHREVQRRKEAQARKRQAKQDDSAKVICTELHRQGLMSRADYVLGADHARTHLTERHYRGYHLWALAAVRHMRRSKRASAFWRVLAQARADHIAYLNGEVARRNRIGAILCAVGYPLCYFIGGFVADQDWQALYRVPSARDDPAGR